MIRVLLEHRVRRTRHDQVNGLGADQGEIPGVSLSDQMTRRAAAGEISSRHASDTNDVQLHAQHDARDIPGLRWTSARDGTEGGDRESRNAPA